MQEAVSTGTDSGAESHTIQAEIIDVCFGQSRGEILFHKLPMLEANTK